MGSDAPVPEVFCYNLYVVRPDPMTAGAAPNRAAIQIAYVDRVTPLCREHLRLTLRVDSLFSAAPGQFVHINPISSSDEGYSSHDGDSWAPSTSWIANLSSPMLRRAFSIAGLRRVNGHTELDVIFRVVGKGTRWMASLSPNDEVSLLGPLGNEFDIRADRSSAWLVAGGVGLPPMLWLADALSHTETKGIAFCGAQTSELLALTLDEQSPPSVDARHATPSAAEFNQCDTPVVISTDDGSLGFHGHIGAAMTAYHLANPIPPDELIVYTCGPERMMEFVARYCVQRGITCLVCMERAMACGTGMCQSCVVPMRDAESGEWRYRLCCTEGPVFPAEQIIWGGGEPN